MRALLNILAPAPHIPTITDDTQLQSTYRHWRWRIFIGMYVGYAIFYFTRKSFTFAMPAMIETLGFTKAQLGLVGSVLYITYGASKFFSGILADRSNPRYFMAIGLILTGILNIFFGCSSSLAFFVFLWGLNGFFQGWGWTPCTKLLMHWYSQAERGRWWGIASTSHNTGGALIPVLATHLAVLYGWRTSMMIPGVIAILAGLFLIYCLRDTPQSLGLPPIEDYKQEQQDSLQSNQNTTLRQEEPELTTKELLFKYVLKNKLIWMLAIAYFFVYVIRTAINDWGQFFLIENKDIPLKSAGRAIFWFEIGGFCGSLLAGWASDKIFKGRRGPINVIFSALVTAAMLLMWNMPAGNVFYCFSVMFIMGFLIFGPQMLIGIAAAELSHKKAAATANGFAGWFAYAGAAFGAFAGGSVTQVFGWEGYFMTMGICGVISVLLLLPMWAIRASPQHALGSS
ncbi:MAG: MFS transporter [Chlamydiales bacterium]|nr:MFS transporter [Chlamydiales bacterium]